ncbi:hypothetical protein [Streptomyces botrytidirepellens]|uniref:Uncharacterized protein n=1 Tax=Streptomyces botrytidirepellens TaxID=2486417 RepID=A0A3M8WYA6_9ACTN|nr:hypothetical protein [Streptomyces botrytidirepellens]RNG33515.1 hypothetical protein EEJ42_07365 [Streptomyces botrytidirepellens]
MGKASRKRREARQQQAGKRQGNPGSKLYREIPRPVIEACEDVLTAYTSGRALARDLGLLNDWPAMIYAEAAALEAVDILTASCGHSGDLLFAELLDDPTFARLAPAMLPLLRFLRGRRAGQNPTLLLDPDTPAPALTLLLLAGQALLSASDGRPGTPAAETTLRECLRRLADSPLDGRTSVGDLAFGLTEREQEQADDEVFIRDQARRICSETLPVRRVLAPADRPALLVLDLTTRPDTEDLLRILDTEMPADGADTVTRWRALAGGNVIRLDVEWLEPVRSSLAVLLDADEHRTVLEKIAAEGRVDLTATDPADSLDSLFALTRVTTSGESLSDVLSRAGIHRA